MSLTSQDYAELVTAVARGRCCICQGRASKNDEGIAFR